MRRPDCVGRGGHDVAPRRRGAAPPRARLHERAAQHAVDRGRDPRRRRHRRQFAAPRLLGRPGRGIGGRDSHGRHRPCEGRRRLSRARAPGLRAVRRHHQGAHQGPPIPADDRAPLSLHRYRRCAVGHDAARGAGRRRRLRHPHALRRCDRSHPGLRGRATGLRAPPHPRVALLREAGGELCEAPLAVGRHRVPDAAQGGPPAGAARSAFHARRSRPRSHRRFQPPHLALLGWTRDRDPGPRDHEGRLRVRGKARHRRL